MESATPVVMNRTGLKTSAPREAKKLLEVTEMTEVEATEGDDSELAAVRLASAGEADPLGSVPPVTKAQRVLKSAAEASGTRPEVLIDKLSQRLAFERTGTRLYDALLVKHAAYSDELPNVSVEALQQIRDEELQHFLLLTEAMTQLGADPTAQTPGADLVGVEGMGLMQVVCDPRTTFVQALDALLVAELADNDGWQTLVGVARVSGLEELAEQFAVALEEEEEHLRQVRTWMSELVTAELRADALDA
jgi:ferritin-like protein